MYSTYLGGSGLDYGISIAFDASGNLCLFGRTYSVDFPILNAYQKTLAGAPDAFVVKIAQSAVTVSAYVPHVANGRYGGGSFKTTFVIFNLSQSAANAQLTLFQDDGSPMSLKISGYGTGSRFNLNLAAGGSVFLETDGSGLLAAGAALVTANVPLGASAIFSVYDAQGRFQTEAGAGDAPARNEGTIPVEIGNRLDTGVAFFNPGQSSATMTLRLLDADGGWAGLVQGMELPSRNHKAQFLSQIFPGLKEFRGSLAISASTGVAALTLRQNAAPLSYTILPVCEGVSKGIEPAVRPLLSQTKLQVSATENTALDVQLPAGYRLTGQISGAGKPWHVVAESETGDLYNGTTDSGGRYSTVLGTGTYKLRTVFWPNGATYSGGEVNVSYDVGQVQVTGDTAKDITLPSLTVYDVSGTVSGLNGLGPAEPMGSTSRRSCTWAPITSARSPTRCRRPQLIWTLIQQSISRFHRSRALFGCQVGL